MMWHKVSSISNILEALDPVRIDILDLVRAVATNSSCVISWRAHNHPMIFLVLARTKKTLARHDDDVGDSAFCESDHMATETSFVAPFFDLLQYGHWQSETDELISGSPDGLWLPNRRG
jgi:hypothetical protein